MVSWYNAVQALHVLSIIAWMAGLLYLPRLFVYHSAAQAGGEAEATFTVMERRLLKGIATPAMIAAYVFGITLLIMQPAWVNDGWLWAKLALVLGMSGMHGYFSKARKRFEAGERPKSERHWRLMNEVPFVMLIGIVFFVLLKPWVR